MKNFFKLSLFFLFNFSFLVFHFAFSQSIDELEAKLKTISAQDKPALLNQLSEAYFQNKNSEKSIDYATQALAAAKKNNDINEETGADINLGNGYAHNGNVKNAVSCYKDAIKIFDQYNQPASSAYVWNKIADSYLASQQFNEAIDANTTALNLFKKANDKSGIANVNTELGDIYFRQKKYESALPYYKQSLAIDENAKDARGQATILEKIGVTYNNWGNFDQGYEFLNKAYELAKNNNLNSIANQISPSLETAKKNRTESEKNKTGYVKQQEEETKQQIKNSEIQINSLSMQNEKSMDEIDKLSYEAQAKELKIKTQNDEIRQKKLETENETRKNELLEKEKELTDAEINRQRLIIWGAIGFSLLGIFLTIFVFNAYRNKKKANDLLKQKNDIIYKQKDQIEQKNILITDSIDYAKNIQDAILPSPDLLTKHFPQSFILYKPKDIVSGDFFWIHEGKDCICVAAADCTGHGVPGAFMSLLGFIMLDDVASTHEDATPAVILKEVNTHLMSMLHQNTENTTGKFGMDVAMIKYDEIKKEITFAGAHNPLIVISNGQINEVKADKISIGTTVNCSFTNQTVAINKGDMIYLYSDGFQDQIGGEKRKKFLSFHLKEFLMEIHSLEPEKQKEALDRKHLEWRAKIEQTDDIIIIGLKV